MPFIQKNIFHCQCLFKINKYIRMHQSLRKGKNTNTLKLIKSCIGKAVIYKFVKHNYSTTLYIYNSILLAYLSTNT